jgi:two-component system chemotaxis response regulator CheB
MVSRPIVVIGASAGGVEALQKLVAQFPADFQASLFIVMHLAPDYPSQLPEILQRVSLLPVTRGTDGEPIEPGHIYVAQPNHHLLLEPGRIRITVGPKENRFRPAVDVLFRSAALAYGVQVTGVVLTGALDDGSSGLLAIKARGGLAVVQDPGEAFCSSMPQNALKVATVDHVVSVSAMGALLTRLARQPVEAGDMEEEASAPQQFAQQMDSEVGIAMGDNGRMREIMALGEFTPFTCPECHGVLVKIIEGKLTRFRCHTGHAFTLSHLLSELTQYNEEVLMTALRALEETELLLTHTREHYDDNDERQPGEMLSQKLELVKQQAALVKQAAMQNEVYSLDSLDSLPTVQNKV